LEEKKICRRRNEISRGRKLAQEDVHHVGEAGKDK